jgi:nicotinamidase-related amidase
MTTALLIIDVQQALCIGDEAAFEIDAVIERINALSRAAREAGVPVVFVQHEETAGSLQAGSAGWQLAPGLNISEGDVRVRKTKSSAFHETELDAALRGRGVSRLVVCGLQSEFCVDSSVRHALALGYDVVLVADGHSTLDSETLSAAQISAHHNRTFRYMTSLGRQITVVPSERVQFAR